MAALTVRLSDEKHARLKALAKARGIPLNALIDEMTTQILAEFDAETRFQVRAMRGKQTPLEEGLALLTKAVVNLLPQEGLRKRFYTRDPNHMFDLLRVTLKMPGTSL